MLAYKVNSGQCKLTLFVQHENLSRDVYYYEMCLIPATFDNIAELQVYISLIDHMYSCKIIFLNMFLEIAYFSK